MENIEFETHLKSPVGLPLIIHDTQKLSHPQTRGNMHENIELLYFYEGEGRVILDAMTYPVCAGDIVVAGSNVVHQIMTDRTLSYLCLIPFRSLGLSVGIDTNRLRFEPYFQDGALAEKLVALKGEYNRENEEFRTAALTAKTLDILVELARGHSVPAEMRAEDSICEAVAYIKLHYREPLTVASVADHVGYSISHLSHTFRARTGFSVIEYINLVRCEFSKALLEDPTLPIGDAFLQCGYQNASYYTRTFRKFNGITPSEYRRPAMAGEARGEREK